MKKLLFLLLIISKVSFAAKPEVSFLVLKEVNYSFFQISQVIRNISDAHLDRILEFNDGNAQTCREIKEKMTPFMSYLQKLNSEFKAKAIPTKVAGSSVKIDEQFVYLQKLTQSSLDKCHTSEVLHVLQKLREEIMNTGFAIQKVEI